jgi:hypothetical protein
MGRVLDEAPGHLAARCRALASHRDSAWIWWPTQGLALNAMDQVWREVKSHLSAHDQYSTIDTQAATPEH